MIDLLLIETRQALRALLRRPAFTLVAAVTLALGIGIDLATFSLVRDLLLRPLPFAEPERLVAVGNRWAGLGVDHAGLSFPELLDQRSLDVFADVGAWREASVNLSEGAGEPERASAVEMTADLPGLLGVEPLLGRRFEAADGEPGAPATVLIGEGLWRRRFGADPAIVGRSVALHGEAHTVIGVLPSGLELAESGALAVPRASDADLWLPIRFDPADPPQRGWRHLRAVARLGPGVSPEQARFAADGLAQRLRSEHSDLYGNAEYGWAPSLRGLHDHRVRESRPSLLLLLVAVTLVALVACANVANLFLSRTTARRRELAVRSALGAGSCRLIRQLAIEVLLVSALGALGGLALTETARRLLVHWRPDLLPASAATLDATLAFYAAGLLLLTALVVLLVALPSRRPSWQPRALRERGVGREATRLRSALVVAQVALAVLLVLGAGLLVRSLQQLQRVDPGFDPRGAWSARIALDTGRYGDPNRQHAFLAELLERLEAEPGLEVAAAATLLPGGGSGDHSLVVEGSPLVAADAVVFEQIRSVTPRYFEAMRIPLLAGRDFTPSDDAAATPVAIVDSAFARRYFGDESPLGRRLKTGGPESAGQWRTIVGVVGATRVHGPAAEAPPVYYLPLAQDVADATSLVLRGTDEAAIGGLRRSLAAVDPRQAFHDARPLRELVGSTTADARLRSGLLAGFALLALALATLGIHGLLSVVVEEQRPAMGIRLALGAEGRHLTALVLGQGLQLTLAGLGLGLLLFLAFARLLGGYLFEVAPWDPTTWLALALLFTGVALLSSWLPAARAARCDPLRVLRSE